MIRCPVSVDLIGYRGTDVKSAQIPFEVHKLTSFTKMTMTMVVNGFQSMFMFIHQGS